MNILILSPFFPYPLSQGGKIRIFNIIKCLSNNNNITLACFSDKEIADYGPLKDYCEEIIVIKRQPSIYADLAKFLIGRGPFNYLKYSSVKMRDMLARLNRNKSFDIVQIEFSFIWQYADVFKGSPIILDAHNIESEIIGQLKERSDNPIKRLLYLIEEKRLRRIEEQAWRQSDLCFTVSERECLSIAPATGQSDKVITIANGVDIERFEFRPGAETGKKILFIGGMDYLPNLNSANYFLSEVFPVILSKMPDIKLDVVGRELWRIAVKDLSGAVQFHESVPDVLPFFRDADLLVVPLRMGAGTRIKILEAMAAGLPVVSTSKGCEGIEVEHGEHLLIADTPASFAEEVQRVLDDAGLRMSLILNARKLVERKYSWEKLAGEMEKAYEIVNREP